VEDTVAEFFGIDKSDVWSVKRDGDRVLARHYYCYILRKRFNLNLTTIGRSLNRDHTTTINSVKTISNMMDVYPESVNIYNSITKLMREMYSAYTKNINQLDIGHPIKVKDLEGGLIGLLKTDKRSDGKTLYSVVSLSDWVNDEVVQLVVEPSRKGEKRKMIYAKPDDELSIFRDYRRSEE